MDLPWSSLKIAEAMPEGAAEEVRAYVLGLLIAQRK